MSLRHLILTIILITLSIVIVLAEPIDLKVYPTPSETLRTYAEGAINCKDLEIVCQEGDQFYFSFWNTQTESSHPLSQLIEPTRFTAYITVFNGTTPEIAPITRVYEGDIDTKYHSDILNLYLTTNPLTADSIIKFVIVVEYSTILPTAIDDDLDAVLSNDEIFLRVYYDQDKIDPSGGEPTPITTTVDQRIIYKYAPAYSYTGETTRGVVITNLDSQYNTTNESSQVLDQTNYHYLVNLALVNTTVPTTHLYLRTFGQMYSTPYSKEEIQQYLPVCTMNGLAMRVRVVTPDDDDDSKPGTYEYDLTLPLVEPPHQLLGNNNQKSLPEKISESTDDDNENLTSSFSSPIDDFYFYGHNQLILTCTLNFALHKYPSFPSFISLGLYPLATPNNTHINYNPDNIPTMIYSTQGAYPNLQIIDLPVVSSNENNNNNHDQLQNEKPHRFKQISLPTYQQHVEPAPNSTLSAGLQQDIQDILELPLVYTQYPREFLVPKHGKRINSTHNDYKSTFIFNYRVTGDVNNWKKTNEQFSFHLQQLPSHTKLNFIKYSILGHSIKTKQMDDNSTIVEHDDWVVLGRGDLNKKKFKIYNYINFYTSIQHTAIQSTKPFTPHIFTRKDYKKHNVCYGECNEGILQIIVDLEHHKLSDREVKSYIPYIPRDPEDSDDNQIYNADMHSTTNGMDIYDEYEQIPQYFTSSSSSSSLLLSPHIPLESIEPISTLSLHQSIPLTTTSSSLTNFTTQHTYQFQRAFAFVDNAETGFIVKPKFHSDKVDKRDVVLNKTTLEYNYSPSYSTNFEYNNNNLDLDNNYINNNDSHNEQQQQQHDVDNHQLPSLLLTNTPSLTTTDLVTNLNNIFVENERFYTFEIVIENITLIDRVSTAYFLLTLNTKEYSFFGNYSTCNINDDIVIPKPFYYSNTTDDIRKLLLSNTEQEMEDIQQQQQTILKFTKSPMLLFKVKLTNDNKYIINCKQSAFFGPTIPIGMFEFLYNDNIPITITTTLPASTSPLISFKQEINNNNNNYKQQLRDVLSQDVIYASSTIIQFTDHMNPGVMAYTMVFSFIIVSLIIISIITHFVTKHCLSKCGTTKEQLAATYSMNHQELLNDFDPTDNHKSSSSKKTLNKNNIDGEMIKSTGNNNRYRVPAKKLIVVGEDDVSDGDDNNNTTSTAPYHSIQ